VSRIRTIKPEILDDERTAALSSDAFRLFIGLISLADDYGNARGHLGFLEGHIFWAAPQPPNIKVAAWELERVGLVQSYVVRGQVYIAITSWAKHQRVDKPGPPRVPGPETAERTGIFTEESFANHSSNHSRMSADSFAPDHDHDHDLGSGTTSFPPTPPARARESDPPPDRPDSERLFQRVRSAWTAANLEAIPVFDDRERNAFYANFTLPRIQRGLSEEAIAADVDLFVERVVGSSIYRQRSLHSILSKPDSRSKIMSGDHKDWVRVSAAQEPPQSILERAPSGGGAGLRQRAAALRRAREEQASARAGPVIETTATVLELGTGGDDG